MIHSLKKQSILVVLQTLFFWSASGQQPQSNYEFLRRDLASAEIVLLGEPEHLSKYYATKIELVKYLHENLGYSVIAFESGFYEMSLVDEDVRKGKSSQEVFERGLFAIWASDDEMIPLFEYIQQQKERGTPLHIAGFDCQPSGIIEISYLIKRLSENVEARVVKNVAGGLVELEVQMDWFIQNSHGVSPFSLERLNSIFALEKAIATEPSLAFENQVVKSWLGFLEYSINQRKLHSNRKFKASDSNARDSLMAINMLYLHHQYAGQKIIGWGATFHFANSLPSLKMNDTDHLDFKPMGWHLKKTLGDKVFTLATTSESDDLQTIEGEWTESGVDKMWISKDELITKSIKTICLREVAEGNFAEVVDGILFTKDREINATALPIQNFLSGVVIDSKTKEPVGFASIWFESLAIGTATDGNGKFQIAMKQVFEGNSFKVSCIGYKTKEISAEDFKQSKGVIRVQSDNTLLNQVTITSQRIDPKKFIRDALAYVKLNYPQQPFNLEFFSNLIFVDSTTNQTYQIESIVKGYYDGYFQGSKKNLKLIHKRETGLNFLKALNYPIWPPWELVSTDLLTDERKSGILNELNVEKFNVRIIGIEMYDGDSIVVLNYSLPKISNKITGYSILKNYSGILYIKMKDNAIVKHRLEIDASAGFVMEITYRKTGGQYFPYYLKSTRINEFKISGIKKKIKTSNELILKSTTTESPSIFENDMKLWDPANIPYDKDFWSASYPKK